MAAVRWVNFTFVDSEARGSADCLATIKLGHDNTHATRRPGQQTRCKDGMTETRERSRNQSILALRQRNYNSENGGLSETKGSNIETPTKQ